MSGDELRAALTPLRNAWQRLSARERAQVAFAAGVLLLFLLWALAVQPAWRAIDAARAELPALDLQWLDMQRLAAESVSLRAVPPVNAAQAAAALQAATERLGEQGRLTLQGNRAVLTVTGIGTRALGGWLAEVRSAARARPIEATLNRAGQGYNGTIVVGIGGES